MSDTKDEYYDLKRAIAARVDGISSKENFDHATAVLQCIAALTAERDALLAERDEYDIARVSRLVEANKALKAERDALRALLREGVERERRGREAQASDDPRMGGSVPMGGYERRCRAALATKETT